MFLRDKLVSFGGAASHHINCVLHLSHGFEIFALLLCYILAVSSPVRHGCPLIRDVMSLPLYTRSNDVTLDGRLPFPTAYMTGLSLRIKDLLACLIGLPLLVTLYCTVNVSSFYFYLLPRTALTRVFNTCTAWLML